MRPLLLSVFTLTFLTVYGLCDWLVEWVPYRIPMGNMSLPFQPNFAPLYLSLNFLILLVFFRCKKQDLAPLFTSLLVQTPIAGLCFLLFPLQAPESPIVAEAWFFKVADLINLENNFLPSLHVAYAITCAFFYRRLLVVGWSFGIVTSTLFTHQHYPVDVIAGVVLAMTVSTWSSKRGRAFSLSVYELARCTLRHRRYGIISMGLLVHLLCRPKYGWRTLLGFAYLQRLDDILDGHLCTRREPEEIALDQIEQWDSENFRNDTLSLLGTHLHATLPDSQHIVPLIKEMILDRQRVRESLVLEESDLNTHLVTTFQLSLDVMLASTEAELRSSDVPGLNELLAWCSVVRDLEEDLELGLVNLPREVWDRGNFEEWFEQEHQRATANYHKAHQNLQSIRGRSGFSILKLFHSSVKKYLERHDNHSLSELAKNHQ